MTNTVKVVLDNIVWEHGAMKPKRTWVRVPDTITGARRIDYIRGYLHGVYGELPGPFTVVEEEVSNG